MQDLQKELYEAIEELKKSDKDFTQTINILRFTFADLENTRLSEKIKVEVYGKRQLSDSSVDK